MSKTWKPALKNIFQIKIDDSDVRKRHTQIWADESSPVSSPQCQGWQRLPHQGLLRRQGVLWVDWRSQPCGARWSREGRKDKYNFGIAASSPPREDCIIPRLWVPGKSKLYIGMQKLQSDEETWLFLQVNLAAVSTYFAHLQPIEQKVWMSNLETN